MTKEIRDIFFRFAVRPRQNRSGNRIFSSKFDFRREQTFYEKAQQIFCGFGGDPDVGVHDDGVRACGNFQRKNGVESVGDPGVVQSGRKTGEAEVCELRRKAGFRQLRRHLESSQRHSEQRPELHDGGGIPRFRRQVANGAEICGQRGV